jgi:hypothetical protein
MGDEMENNMKGSGRGVLRFFPNEALCYLIVKTRNYHCYRHELFIIRTICLILNCLGKVCLSIFCPKVFMALSVM